MMKKMVSKIFIAALVMQGADAAEEPFPEKTFERNLINQLFDSPAKIKGNWIDRLNDMLASFHYPSTFKGSDSNSLFAAYPALQAKIPYIALGALPTPMTKLAHISKKYGVEVYMKNDALTGGNDADGAPLYGGNKIRKLGFIFGQAQSLGAEKFMAPGCVASNYAVAAAACAHRLGMAPICMLKHQPPSYVVQHNLLMHLHYGSELHYSADNDIRTSNAITVWLDHYKKDGKVPYVTPTGGSNMYGTLGFVDAAFELAEQIKQGVMPQPTHIYVATGSCATTAGLLLGLKVAGVDAQIVAVATEPIGPDEYSTFAQAIDRLFKETNQYLHDNDNSFPLVSYTDKNLRIDLNFTGPDYGVFTPEGMTALDEMLTMEGVLLEGTYTAKAFAALLNDIKEQPTAKVLFWNTYSGLDFTKQLKNQDYKKLPKVFHDYFQEKNIQPLARKK